MMPDESKRERVNPSLEVMSVEELEDLLRQDFVATGDELPDADYLLEILEVIQRKETQESGTAPVDTSAALKEFKEEYVGHEDVWLSGCDLPSVFEAQGAQPAACREQGRPRRRVRKLRHVMAAAAAVLVVIGLVPAAFGVNVFKIFASWTADTFGFDNSDSPPVIASPVIDGDDPYLDMRAATAAETPLTIIPTWAPEGTVPLDATQVVEKTESTRIKSSYSMDNGDFSIAVTVYHSQINYNGEYQKDDEAVVVYESGGVTHYILSNLDETIVSWMNGNVECMIRGNLSTAQAKKMIDSIYGGN